MKRSQTSAPASRDSFFCAAAATTPSNPSTVTRRSKKNFMSQVIKCGSTPQFQIKRFGGLLGQSFQPLRFVHRRSCDGVCSALLLLCFLKLLVLLADRIIVRRHKVRAARPNNSEKNQCRQYKNVPIAWPVIHPSSNIFFLLFACDTFRA